MAITSKAMNMQSLATTYTLGLTAGGAMNLIAHDPSSDVKQDIIYTLGAALGALTMGIFWKYIYSEDKTDPKILSTKRITVDITKDKISATENKSRQDKLTVPIVFGLGMLAGVKLNGSLFPSFYQGVATLGLALLAKKQEEEGILNWEEFCED